MKYNNEKNIKYIINKIFNGKKIKENFIVIHSSTIPFRLNHNDVKIFWKELRKFLGNKVTIIMPSFSYISTIETVVMLGLKPILIDVKEETISFSLIKKSIIIL